MALGAAQVDAWITGKSLFTEKPGDLSTREEFDLTNWNLKISTGKTPSDKFVLTSRTATVRARLICAFVGGAVLTFRAIQPHGDRYPSRFKMAVVVHGSKKFRRHRAGRWERYSSCS